MALSEAILVCLADRSMSGYDLAKTFDASIGFFWRASHQQIYRELGKLRDRGLVESREITQSGKPNRIVHTITPAGEKALLQWSSKPSRMPSLKDELLVKFYALGHVDIDALKDQLTIRIEQHQTKLSKYLKIKERYYSNEDTTMNQAGKRLVLEMGIQEEQGRIQWLQDLMIELTRLEKSALKSSP